MTLGDTLYAIAQGEMYSEKAIYQAMHHPVTTGNDRDMLRRYAFGSFSSSDRFRLQELAIVINNSDKLIGS